MGRIYQALYGRGGGDGEGTNGTDSTQQIAEPVLQDGFFQALDPGQSLHKRWGRQLRKTAVAIESLLQVDKEKGYIVMLTGCVERAGTSAVVENLACTMSLTGQVARVLIVDCNLYRQPASDSLLNYLDSYDAASLLAAPIVDGVYRVEAGISELQGREMGLPMGLQNFLTQARSHFDCILIDAPTFGQTPLSDALGKSADGVVLVVPCSRVRLPALHAMQADMEHLGVEFLGVLLNQRQYPLPKWLLRFI